MTILIHEYQDLEERASKHLTKWKVWHTVLFVLAAILGAVNYTFLQNSMALIDNNCILYPRDLRFQMVEIYDFVNHYKQPTDKTDEPENVKQVESTENNWNEDFTENANDEDDTKNKQSDLNSNDTITEEVEVVRVDNGTVIVGNKTHRLMLDTVRSLFGDEGCEFTEYMPVMATVIALIWTVLFVMCPGGGYSRSGLLQPWRILVPALLFALVMVGLTGHNFTTLSKGITAFCEDFKNLTKDGSCNSVSLFLEDGWNASFGFGPRTTAVQAVAAALWITWAIAAAVLLARCLTGPDFVVKRTHVLINDPQNKLLPYLVPISQSSARSSGRSDYRKDNISTKSDPTTVTTELVTATVEIPHDSSLSPASDRGFDITEDIEMTEKNQKEKLERDP